MKNYMTTEDIINKYGITRRRADYFARNFGELSPTLQLTIFMDSNIEIIEEIISHEKNCVILSKYKISIGLQPISIINSFITNKFGDVIKHYNKDYTVSQDIIDVLEQEYPILKAIQSGCYLTHTYISELLDINPSTIKRLIKLHSDEIIIHPVLNSVLCVPKSFLNNSILLEQSEKNSKIIKNNGIDFYRGVYVQKILNISRDSFYTLIKQDDIPLFKLNGRSYIEKTWVENLVVMLSNTFETVKLSEIYKNISARMLLKITRSNVIHTYFPNAFKSTLWGVPSWRVYKEDVDYFYSNHYDDLVFLYKVIDEKDPFKLFALRMNNEFLDCKFPKTFETYVKFGEKEITDRNVRNIRMIVNRLVNTFNTLNSKLKFEIFEFNTKSRTAFIKESNFNSYELKIIVDFITYCAILFPRKVKNIEKITVKNLSLKKKSATDVYSLSDWLTYFEYAVDINRHILKAFDNYYYAKMWVYFLLHFSVVWRNGDFLDLPGVPHINVEKYDINWFEKNEFNLSDGQTIIDALKQLTEMTSTNKTVEELHFIIYLDMVIPTAISIIILEKHRRIRNDVSLMGNCDKIELKNHFQDCPKINKFRNLKANRTLLSINLAEANKNSEFSNYSYRMASYLRSHKINEDGISKSTTQKYLRALNLEGDLDSVTYNLFNRGTFGHTFYTLVNLSCNHEKFSLGEMTEQIIALKDKFSLISLESFGEFTLYNSDDVLHVLNRLIIMDEDDIKTLLKELSEGKHQTRTLFTQCLLKNECIYKNKSTCFGCNYNIPSIFAMHSLSRHIISIIKDYIKMRMIEMK